MKKFVKILNKTTKGFICLASLLGIMLQCGVFDGKLDLSVMTYFTLMSNLACFIYFAFDFIFDIKSNFFSNTVKGAIMLCISVTGLVYHFMLAGKFTMQGTLFWSNTLLHYVVPVSVILQWLLFDKKGTFNKAMPFMWLIAPLAYGVFVHVAVYNGAVLGPYGSKYPYYFMDPAQLGMKMTIIVTAGMAIAFLILGFIYYFVDLVLSKLNKR